MQTGKDFLAALEQEVNAYRRHLQQAVQVAEELAGLLETTKKVRQDLEHELQNLQDLLAQASEDLEKLHREWQGLRNGLEEWARKLEAQVQEHLKESQNRLSEIQHLTFKRLDRVEDQLGKHRAELEEKMKGLEEQMGQTGQQIEKVQQIALARYLEVRQTVLGLRRQVFALWVALGLLALGAYVLGR